MSDREQDKRVAEILGFVVVHEHWMRPVDQPHNYRVEQRLPRYTTDPAADYKVLEWVREQRGAPTLFARMAELICPKSEPVADAVGLLECYEPGDYSRALLALDEQGLLK